MEWAPPSPLLVSSGRCSGNFFNVWLPSVAEEVRKPSLGGWGLWGSPSSIFGAWGCGLYFLKTVLFYWGWRFIVNSRQFSVRNVSKVEQLREKMREGERTKPRISNTPVNQVVGELPSRREETRAHKVGCFAEESQRKESLTNNMVGGNDLGQQAYLMKTLKLQKERQW